MIKYENIELKPPSHEQYERILTWYNTMPKHRLMRARVPYRAADIPFLVEREHFFAINLNSSQCIGFAELDRLSWKNRNAQVFSFVDLNIDRPEEQDFKANKALMNYGFGELGLNKMWATYVVDDVYLKRLYESLGFHTEVRLRNHHFADGHYHHVLEVGLLASEHSHDRNEYKTFTVGKH